METMSNISIGTLHQGRLMEQVDEALASVCADVVARPGVDMPRKVTVTITVTPDYNAEIDQNFPEIQANVDKKIPGAKLGKQVGQVIGGSVQVNSSPHYADPNKAQMRLDEAPANVTQLRDAK